MSKAPTLSEMLDEVIEDFDREIAQMESKRDRIKEIRDRLRLNNQRLEEGDS